MTGGGCPWAHTIVLNPTFVAFPWRRQSPEAHLNVHLPDVLNAAPTDGEAPLSITLILLVRHVCPHTSSHHNTMRDCLQRDLRFVHRMEQCCQRRKHVNTKVIYF